MRTGFFAAAASSGSGPGAPGAVRNLVATPGSELVNLSWTAPVSNGGSSITNHQFQAAPSSSSAGGTHDTAFTTGTGTGFNDLTTQIAIQPDGKIVVVGWFTTFKGATVNRIVRLNADGTHDTAFTANTGAGFGLFTNVAVVQSDGKILIGGVFADFNNATANRIVRLNADGTRDTTFTTNTGTAFNDSVYAIAIQSDGKILVGGDFTTFNGTTVNRIVRLNADGTRDTTFTTSTGTAFNAYINTVAIQSDGKILVGGSFTNFNGTAVNRIVRLNADGTRDTAFSTAVGSGFNSFVISIAIQSDGRIVISGSFTTFNGVQSFFIVRLNADGTRDTSFTTNIGTSFNAFVNAIAIGSDGKIVAVGSFTTFNGATVNRIIRHNGDRLWSSVSSSGSSGTSYTFTGLSSSVEYVLRARVVNAIGASPWVETTTPVTPNVAAVVTGGALTSDSTYYYRTFTSSGTLGISAAPLNIDYALCSGGEGGDGYTAPTLSSQVTNTAVGGRGALVTQGSTSGAFGSISIVVGAGGAGGVRYYAGDEIYPAPSTAAYGTASSIGATSSVTANTTYADGTFVSIPTNLGNPSTRQVNGGGAGSSANGGNASATPGGTGGFVYGGNGGPGTTVFGVTLGGGGGAASMTLVDQNGPYTYTGVEGSGGSGGGGNGGVDTWFGSETIKTPTNGAANTGGGGGGGVNDPGATGGTGGSGIVIVRYLKSAVGG